MRIRDPELLELLGDEAELLALADAVAATQQPPRRPLLQVTPPRLAAVGVVAAVAVALALVLPQGKHGIVDRALAAIGDGRVVHIVAEVPTGTVDVDLKTGRRTVEQSRVEVWADQRLQRLHAVMSIRGEVYADLLWPEDAKDGATLGPVDPAMAGLWSGYREALEDGTATRAGEGVAFGHKVYWLRFRSTDPKSPGSEVAVDADTFKPVVYRVYHGARATDQHILLAETLDFSSADFTRSGPNPMLSQLSSGSTGGSSMSSDSARPETTVPRGWLTAGTEVAGQKLAAVIPQTVTTDEDKTTQGIQLVYGDLRHGFAAPTATTVDQLPEATDPATWARIPVGSVEIGQGESGRDGAQPLWTGYLVKNGRYVTITTSRGERALVTIARSLRPVR